VFDYILFIFIILYNTAGMSHLKVERLIIHSFHSFHWHMQNAMIPCHSQKLLPFLSVTYPYLPLFSTNSLPSSLTSSCHLFLGLPLSLVVSKFTYITFFGILFSSILCTCPNHRNIFNLNVSVIVGFLTTA